MSKNWFYFFLLSFFLSFFSPWKIDGPLLISLITDIFSSPSLWLLSFLKIWNALSKNFPRQGFPCLGKFFDKAFQIFRKESGQNKGLEKIFGMLYQRILQGRVFPNGERGTWVVFHFPKHWLHPSPSIIRQKCWFCNFHAVFGHCGQNFPSARWPQLGNRSI